MKSNLCLCQKQKVFDSNFFCFGFCWNSPPSTNYLNCGYKLTVTKLIDLVLYVYSPPPPGCWLCYSPRRNKTPTSPVCELLRLGDTTLTFIRLRRSESRDVQRSNFSCRTESIGSSCMRLAETVQCRVRTTDTRPASGPLAGTEGYKSNAVTRCQP